MGQDEKKNSKNSRNQPTPPSREEGLPPIPDQVGPKPQQIDFSALTMDTRTEPRFAYRVQSLLSRPPSQVSQMASVIDVSRSGMSLALEKCQFQLGDEVFVEFFGPNAPTVHGKFRIMNQCVELREGKVLHRIGLSRLQMNSLAEKNYESLLEQLETKAGFDFSHIR